MVFFLLSIMSFCFTTILRIFKFGTLCNTSIISFEAVELLYHSFISFYIMWLPVANIFCIAKTYEIYIATKNHKNRYLRAIIFKSLQGWIPHHLRFCWNFNQVVLLGRIGYGENFSLISYVVFEFYSLENYPFSRFYHPKISIFLGSEFWVLINTDWIRFKGWFFLELYTPMYSLKKI